MKKISKIFKLNSESREEVITATSTLGIVVNLVISIVKVLIGTAAASIAIISEGINNATDAATSIITIVGVKLANKKPTKNHPFGFGRIEYFTSLIIAILILLTGTELLKSSIQLITNPAELQVSTLTLIIIGVTAIIKLLLGAYTIKKGKQVNADSLIALGTDCRNDSIISAVTIASVIAFLVFDIYIDAYAGIITAIFILKSAVDIFRTTISDLLGKAGNKELAYKLYNEIIKTEGVLNAADMILHNYGPDSYSGSVNVELDCSKSVGEIYQTLHKLQLRIMHEYNVVMVFGVYAVDNKTEDSKKMRKEIAKFVTGKEHVKSFHALYHDKKAKRIYCDLIVDYSNINWSELEEEFVQYMKELYPEESIELTIETEFI